MNWDALRLSVLVTTAATVLIVVVGLPLALLLARRRFRGHILLETIIFLPLVLPPTVVGYHLLLILGRNGPIAGWLDAQLLFTWGAAALAAGQRVQVSLRKDAVVVPRPGSESLS